MHRRAHEELAYACAPEHACASCGPRLEPLVFVATGHAAARLALTCVLSRPQLARAWSLKPSHPCSSKALDPCTSPPLHARRFNGSCNAMSMDGPLKYMAKTNAGGTAAAPQLTPPSQPDRAAPGASQSLSSPSQTLSSAPSQPTAPSPQGPTPSLRDMVLEQYGAGLHLTLSVSFRLGPEVAQVARRWGCAQACLRARVCVGMPVRVCMCACARTHAQSLCACLCIFVGVLACSRALVCVHVPYWGQAGAAQKVLWPARCLGCCVGLCAGGRAQLMWWALEPMDGCTSREDFQSRQQRSGHRPVVLQTQAITNGITNAA